MKKCEICKQPKNNHCNGCHIDIQNGIKIKRFCGKRGNEVSEITSCKKEHPSISLDILVAIEKRARRDERAKLAKEIISKSLEEADDISVFPWLWKMLKKEEKKRW